MLRLLAALTLALGAASASAQPVPSVLVVRVLDAHEGTPLPGATVRLGGTPFGATTDDEGLAAVHGAPDGPAGLVVTFVGYAESRLGVVLPRADTVEVRMEEDEEELDELVVSTTRTRRSIADTPTRVEAIGGEEIEEKINMDPSGIAMVLNESPGIAVQQGSAVSAGASFRIQGLDGRHTQLLRDGRPLYGGLGGGLSILQTPPLDLAAVEVIKGPASTLYGGGAVAGIVNLVPKRPSETAERSVLLNATSAGGLDAAGYYAKRGARTGVTALVSANAQRAYDAEADGYTNLPAVRRLTAAPTFYAYGRGVLEVGLAATAEDRRGGAVGAVRSGAAGYAERNTSERLSGHAAYDRPLSESARLRLRTGGSTFRRALRVPAYRFAGRQTSSYTEASAGARVGAHDLVGGLDLRTDLFDQTDGVAAPANPDDVGAGTAGDLGHDHAALGAFVQDTWDVGPAVAVEGGLRVDRHNRFGTFVLPRASVLVRPAPGVAVRAGGGLGYTAPTALVEAAEAVAFAGVAPLGPDVRAETATGGSVDADVRTTVAGRVALSVNQAVYGTRLRRALTAGYDRGGRLVFTSADSPTTVWGSETTARLAAGDVSLFLGYVFLDAHREAAGARVHPPLTARHRTYTVLVWERHGAFRVGAEAYYTGPQERTDGSRTPGYWLAGLMGERRFGAVRAFVNFENVLDARQSLTEPFVTGPPTAPRFAEVWGPTDGFIANAGLKIAL